MGKQFKRSRLWVNPAFQFRMLFRMGFYLFLYFFIVWHVGFFFEVLRCIVTNHWEKGMAQLYVQFLLDQRPLLFALVMITPFCIYDLIKFSHRIAGPLYRCRHVMREMAAGKPVPEFRPRKHDLMPELFQDFNTLIKEWNARVGAGMNGHQAPSNGQEMAAKTTNPAQGINVGAEPQQVNV